MFSHTTIEGVGQEFHTDDVDNDMRAKGLNKKYRKPREVKNKHKPDPALWTQLGFKATMMNDDGICINFSR